MEPGENLEAAVRSALSRHSAVSGVRVAGSRADGSAHELSDWDFIVETDAFEELARDLPRLVAPLAPIAEQWDPYSSIECYMLMLPGPTKVDLLFPDRSRDWALAWRPSAATLPAIDRHFWDWILWLEQKRRGGHADVFREGLANMFELMLGPMGVGTPPRSVADALAAYVQARAALELAYDVQVPRRLEQEVRRVVGDRSVRRPAAGGTTSAR